MAKNKVTASNFLPHLLAVMGTMTDFTAGVPVVFTDTFKPVCDRMGIKENTYGTYKPTNKLKTHHLIGLAFRSMRDNGFGEYEKKGVWRLTQEGVEESKRVLNMVDETDSENPESAVQEAPDPTLAAAKVQEIVEDDEETADVVRLPMIPSYHADPYIRSLAIEQTPCFGFHSERSSTCSSCPLAQECEARVLLEKSVLAEVLTVSQNQAKEKNESIDDLIASFDEESRQNPSASEVRSTARAHRDSLCLDCGKKIAKGSTCLWIKNKGLVHSDCR